MRQKGKMYSEEKMTQDRSVSKNYGFRSDYAPPKNEHLNAFENDLYDMVRNIEFTQIKSAFLSRLKNEVNSIKKSSNIIISADKTSNMYEMGKESYQKLLKENVTKVYKKVDDTTVNKINKKRRVLVVLSLDKKKVECYANRPAFIYIKKRPQRKHRCDCEAH